MIVCLSISKAPALLRLNGYESRNRGLVFNNDYPDPYNMVRGGPLRIGVVLQFNHQLPSPLSMMIQRFIALLVFTPVLSGRYSSLH